MKIRSRLLAMTICLALLVFEPLAAIATEISDIEPPVDEMTTFEISEDGKEEESAPVDAGDEQALLPEDEATVIDAENVLAAAATLPTELICPDTLYIGVKESYYMPYSLVPENAAAEITYTSKNEKVVKVDASGLMTGKKTGSTSILVDTSNGLEKECEIIVLKAPSKVTLKESTMELAVGESRGLSVSLPSKTASQIYCTSSDPTVASVDGTVVTGRKGGKATITVSTFNKKKATCEVRVVAVPTGITLPDEALNMGAGQKSALKPEFQPEGAGGAVSYVSSDTSVAVVDADGTVTAVKVGSAEITATTYNGCSAKMTVNVAPAPTSVSIEPANLSLGLNQVYQLKPVVPEGSFASYTYKVSGGKAVTVSDDGLVKANKTGNAKVTITTYNGKSTTCSINVGKKPTSLQLSESSVTLGVGQVYTPQVTLLPKNSGGTLNYKSSDESVLSTAGGRLTAVALGKAVLTVSTYNGLTAACNVTVKKGPTAVALYEKSVKVSVGMTLPLQWSIADGSVEEDPCTFESSNAKIATVDAKGVVTGKKAGKATVTIRTWNDRVDTCEVEVAAAPTSIKLDKTKASLGAGEDLQLNYTLKPANAVAGITWTSSNEAVATVDDNGRVHALSKGSATITVLTSNKKKSTCKLTVTGPVIPSEKTVLLSVGLGVSLAEEFPGETLSGFTSDNANIASVDANGMIIGKKKGDAGIFFTDATGKVRACTVRVLAAPTMITLDRTKAEIEAGESLKLTYTLKAADTPTIVIWTSSDEKVAKVDANGVVYGVGQGTATITAKTHNGKTSKCSLTVKPGSVPPQSDFKAENGVLVEYTGQGGNIVIPASDASGNPITAIGSGVFAGRTDITGVTISTGIVSVGASAFEGCAGLKSVVISNGVSEIGAAAFKNCSSLSSMTTIG